MTRTQQIDLAASSYRCAMRDMISKGIPRDVAETALIDMALALRRQRNEANMVAMESGLTELAQLGQEWEQ